MSDPNIVASVHLSRVHLTLATDPTVGITAGTASRSDTTARSGTFRTNAAGGVRLIVNAAKARQIGFTLIGVSPADVLAMDDLLGKIVLFRDTYGRRIYGGFLGFTVADIPHSGVANDTLLTNVQITLTQVSYTEGV